MYLLKTAHPISGDFTYLTKDTGWNYNRKNALRIRAEEVILIYKVLSAEFRTSSYTIELERVED